MADKRKRRRSAPARDTTRGNHAGVPSTVRIIAGQWRRRRLKVPSVPGLRPTPDRVRETLFNWLGPAVVGASCLDLFAGTGALGFEAASRGAARVVMPGFGPANFFGLGDLHPPDDGFDAHDPCIDVVTASVTVILSGDCAGRGHKCRQGQTAEHFCMAHGILQLFRLMQTRFRARIPAQKPRVGNTLAGGC